VLLPGEAKVVADAPSINSVLGRLGDTKVELCEKFE
jgi:hypothetical protein